MFKSKSALIVAALGSLLTATATLQAEPKKPWRLVEPPRPWAITEEDFDVESRDSFVKYKSPFDFSAEVSFVSKYVFRGVKLEEFSAQPSFAVAHSSGLYGGFFANIPIKHAGHSEYDVNVGWQLPTKKITYDVGFTAYFTPEYDDWVKHREEFYVGVDFRPVQGFGVRAYSYYDVRMDMLTVEGSIAYAIQLNPSVSYMPAYINVSASYGYADGNDTAPDSGRKIQDSYSYYGFSVEVPTRLTRNVMVNFGVSYGTARGFHNWKNDKHVWGFATLIYKP